MLRTIILKLADYNKIAKEWPGPYDLYIHNKNQRVVHPRKGFCGRCNKDNKTLLQSYGAIMCVECNKEMN